MGGVNIRREFRNKGLGKILMHYLDNYLSTASIKTTNLFTSSPHAMKIYLSFGWKTTGTIVVDNIQNQIMTKTYSYNKEV